LNPVLSLGFSNRREITEKENLQRKLRREYYRCFSSGDILNTGPELSLPLSRFDSFLE
jgi:hypothetical protein